VAYSYKIQLAVSTEKPRESASVSGCLIYMSYLPSHSPACNFAIHFSCSFNELVRILITLALLLVFDTPARFDDLACLWP
jgi:hypothetical protein